MVNSSWKDYETHGRRLSKILKILDKKFDRIPKDDIDGLARIAATIGNITNHIVNLIKIVDMYDEISAKYEEDMKEQRQQEATVRKYRREAAKTTKQELVNEINRAEYAAANDELVSKRHTQEMRI